VKKTINAGLTLAVLASLASLASLAVVTTTACGKKDEHAAPSSAPSTAASNAANAPAAPSHPPAAPGNGAPPAEAIAGKAAPADAIHSGAGTAGGANVAGQTADPHAGLQSAQIPAGTGRKGKITETMNASTYTYIKVDENGKAVWLAVMQTPVKVGQVIEFPNVPPMTNFTSKSMNRTFAEILFVPTIRIEK
jgi:hypothetical protein